MPENYTDFFYWVKERTEALWQGKPGCTIDDFEYGKWIYGAKWIGMKEEDIDAVEEKYAVKFTSEHREFLKILHTIDRKEPIEYTTSFEKDAETIIKQVSLFHNWLEDDEEIKYRMNWPYRTILDDILGGSKVWLKSWGKRPASDEGKEAIFSEWLKNAPRLIPLTSHRFLVGDPELKDRPVLSVWGSDIIVYGWDLRLYLLNEIGEYLNISEDVYDEEDQCYYSEDISEIKQIRKAAYTAAVNKDIPYWKEMILIWSSGWSSFGMKSPRDNGDTVQSIMKTYTLDDVEDNQKTFNSYSS
jgi:hypothetical protein